MVKDKSVFACTQCFGIAAPRTQWFCIARDDRGTIWVGGALVTGVQGAVQL
jgi:hypothetical protein